MRYQCIACKLAQLFAPPLLGTHCPETDLNQASLLLVKVSLISIAQYLPRGGNKVQFLAPNVLHGDVAAILGWFKQVDARAPNAKHSVPLLWAAQTSTHMARAPCIDIKVQCGSHFVSLILEG